MRLEWETTWQSVSMKSTNSTGTLQTLRKLLEACNNGVGKEESAISYFS